jgi:hypothetical protein
MCSNNDCIFIPKFVTRKFLLEDFFDFDRDGIGIGSSEGGEDGNTRLVDVVGVEASQQWQLNDPNLETTGILSNCRISRLASWDRTQSQRQNIGMSP